MASSKAFGRWLTRRMAENDMNLSGLARRLGLSHSSVVYWVKGETRPKPDNIRKLAGILGVPVTEVHEALGDIPVLDNLTPQLRRIVSLLLEREDPQLYRAVEALILSLREE